MTGYPFDLAGTEAPPPDDVPARLLGMAQRAADRVEPDPEVTAAAVAVATDLGFGARPWRSAFALDVLFAEADAACPDRSKRSDGRIGNAAHAALGEASDHNPWVVHGGIGIVRAGDITNDPELKLAAAFERLRRLAAAGKLPQVLVGGYAILNGRITASDWSGWREYRGDNKHVLHGHVSLSLTPAQFDSKARWGIFAEPDVGPLDVRWLEQGAGHYPPADPRHEATKRLQRRLKTREPVAARRLAVDGRFGEHTEAVVRVFQKRRGLRGDGVAGPLTLYRLGL